MSYLTESDVLPLAKLDKGMDTFSPDDALPEGFYPDAENMDLRRKTPHTIDGTVPLTQSPPPDGGNIVWGDVYRTNVSDEVVLVTDKGTLYAYTPATDSYKQLRTGLATNARYYTSAPFRTQRIITNGVDVPLRYDGSLAHPLGSKIVSTFEEDWQPIPAIRPVSVDKDIVHARQGAAGLRVTSVESGVVGVFYAPTTPLDMLTGLDGGPNFANDDVVRFQVFVPDSAAFSGQTGIKEQTVGALATSNPLHIGAGAAQWDQAARVVPNSSFNVSRIRLQLFRSGVPTGNLTLTIQTDAAGVPSNSVLSGGTSNVVLEASVGADTEHDFVFPNLPSLAAGTTYWLVLTTNRGLDAANFVYWRGTSFLTGRNRATNTQATPGTWVSDSSGSPFFKIFGGSGALEVRFYTNTTTPDYFAAAASGFTNGWNTLAIRQSDFGKVGVPNWATIVKIEVRLTASQGTSVTLDDLVLAYNLSPPPAQIVVVYGSSVYLADIPSDRVKIIASDVSQPNVFPLLNFLRVTAGAVGLETEDYVSAMKIYASVIIVGKPRSIFSLAGAPQAWTLDPFTTEVGCDSHRSVVEAPRALYFLYGQTILGLRLTARDVISQEITPLLANLDFDNRDQNVGTRHHEEHRLQWTLRLAGETENSLIVTYDYFLNAWQSRITAYKVKEWFPRPFQGKRRMNVIGYGKQIFVEGIGEQINGQPLVSRLRFPWKFRPAQQPNDLMQETRWVGTTLYVRGTAPQVEVWFRVAHNPKELETAVFIRAGSVLVPGSDQAFVDFGDPQNPGGTPTARFIQVELRSKSGQFEWLPPGLVHFYPTERNG